MTESIITYRPITKYIAAILLGTLGSVILGYILSDYIFSLAIGDLLINFTVFVAIPLLLTIAGFSIGWNGKKNAVDYNEPKWEYEPAQFSIEDTEKMYKEHKRKYWRMVANSNYWIFFIPVALLIFMAALPVYLMVEAPSLAPLDKLMFSLSLGLSFTVASVGSLRATSNSASDDFTILLVREAVKLAKAQEGIPGITNIRIIFDKAEKDGFSIYDAPRVVSRISGIEREGYIESWTEDIGAVNRVLCRLYKFEEHPEVVWWWFSEDRYFRKYPEEDKTGYYVKYPLSHKSGNPGVKDPRRVIENAVAIMILEWFHTRGEREDLSGFLESLGVESRE